MTSSHKNNSTQPIAIFDGKNGIIQLLHESINVRELYSRWVDWAVQGDNLKYFPAIDASLLPNVMGGCSATIKHRWRIKPVNKPHILKVFGSIALDDGSSPFIDTDGGHEVEIEYSSYINESDAEKLKKQGANEKLGGGKPKGAYSALRKAMIAVLTQNPNMTNDDLWMAIKSKPPRGHLLGSTSVTGRYVEVTKNGKTTSSTWDSLKNTASKVRGCDLQKNQKS